MKIINIASISIPVSNYDTALDFYITKLKFEKVVDMKTGEKTRWIEVKPKDSETSLILVSKDQHIPGEQLTGLLHGGVLFTDNLKATSESFHKDNVKNSGIQTTNWGSYLLFNDPDGNSWMIREYN